MCLKLKVLGMTMLGLLTVGCLRDFDRNLIPGGSTGGAISSVATAAASSCAVTSTGELWCWGSTNSSQLGAPTEGITSPPVRVIGDWTSVSSSSGFAATACAIAPDRSLHCWGNNGNGELGLGDFEGRASPTQVGTDNDWIQTDGGNSLRCGIRDGGAMYCAGWAADGRLGFAPEGSYATTFQRVPISPPIASFDVYASHTLALDVDGQLWSWGSNAAGQLGREGSEAPAQTHPGERYLQISTGERHSCGIRSTGALFCWGANDEGQLGRSDAAGGISPEEVEGGLSFRTVACGALFSCAITTDGELYCWGNNAVGQLGQGNRDAVNIPTQVGTQDDWLQVSAGAEHVCATSPERVFCWGSSSHDQNGQGAPVEVPAVVFLEEQ